MTPADWVARLEHSFAVENENNANGPTDKLVYLADHIFDFTTYDEDMSRAFAIKALEVCRAISGRTTFEYIKDVESYTWYILMCNIPFFARRIEWGTSIRGAWWGGPVEFSSCGLWDGENQLHETICFSRDEWANFITGVLLFADAAPKELTP